MTLRRLDKCPECDAPLENRDGWARPCPNRCGVQLLRPGGPGINKNSTVGSWVSVTKGKES